MSPGMPAVWRLSLEQAGSGERHGFHSPEELAAYLTRVQADEAQDDPPRTEE